DVGEDLVLGEAPLDVAVAVAPGPELLDDPRREPGWGVGEPEGGGLRFCAVYGGVGSLGRAPGRDVFEPGALLGREIGRVSGEDGQPRVGTVNGQGPVGMIERQVAADVAAEVAARQIGRGP